MIKSLKITLSLITLALLAATASAQQTMSRIPRFDQFRGIGDSRTWQIKYFDSTIGFVNSDVLAGPTADAVTIKRSVTMDYRLTGGAKTGVEGSHFVLQSFDYLGDKLAITVEERTESLELNRTASSIEGFVTRSGEKVAQSAAIPPTFLQAFDIVDFDLIEAYLASRDLRVGDSLIDSVFVPQTLTTMVLRGKIERMAIFENKSLGRSDTAFEIQLAQPHDQNWFFTVDRRLSHVRWPKRNIAIYQTKVKRGAVVRPQPPAPQAIAPIVQTPPKPFDSQPRAPIVDRDSIVKRLQSTQRERLSKGLEQPDLPAIAYVALLPHFILYFALGLVWFLVVTQGSLRRSSSWIAIVVGVGLGVIGLVTQIPLQRWIVINIVYPGITESGGSVLTYGILPAITGSLIQGVLIFFGVGALGGQAKGSARLLAIMGGAIGVGFGFVEACYMQKGVGITPLFAMTLVERAFLLAFHVSAAAFFGALLFKNLRLALTVAVSLVVVNALFRYLPMLVQARVVDVGILYFVMASLSLGIVVWAMLSIRYLPIIQARPRPAPSEVSEGRSDGHSLE